MFFISVVWHCHATSLKINKWSAASTWWLALISRHVTWFRARVSRQSKLFTWIITPRCGKFENISSSRSKEIPAWTRKTSFKGKDFMFWFRKRNKLQHFLLIQRGMFCKLDMDSAMNGEVSVSLRLSKGLFKPKKMQPIWKFALIIHYLVWSE